jgi:glutathione S-transferase
MRSVEEALATREYLCAGRFTIADICVGYAVVLANSLDIQEVFTPNVKRWFDRLAERPAYRKAFDL